MDSKSHDKDQILTLLLNAVESLDKKAERLEDALKKNSDISNTNTTASRELKETISNTNKTFDKVAQHLQDIYQKIQGLEVLQKMMGGLGPLFGGGKK